MRRLSWTIAALALLVGVCALAQTQQLTAADLWSRLSDTTNGCPASFDYFPDGGMRNFYCHLRAFVPFEPARLKALAGVPVFASGPHREALKLDARFDFGHYNKDFVRWLTAQAIPGASDPALRERTQPVYDKVVAPLARMYLGTWRRLQQNREWTKREAEWLRASAASGNLPAGYVEKYYSVMDSAFFASAQTEASNLGDGAWEGNVAKTAVAFWLRRTLDGTADEFYAGLTRLMQTYDKEFFSFAGTTVELLDSPDDSLSQVSAERTIAGFGAVLVRNKAVGQRARTEIYFDRELETKARALAAALKVAPEDVKPLTWKARGPIVVAFANARPK